MKQLMKLNHKKTKILWEKEDRIHNIILLKYQKIKEKIMSLLLVSMIYLPQLVDFLFILQIQFANNCIFVYNLL